MEKIKWTRNIFALPGKLHLRILMKQLTIALIREDKSPPDNRVAFTPVQCQWLMNKYPELAN